MPGDSRMRIHSPEVRSMSDRVLRVTALTPHLNVLPFADHAGKAESSALIRGRPVPQGA